jgi:propane monooxygenase reductase subunit
MTGSEHSVTVLPVRVEFAATEEEPILEAAIRAGLVLPYGCRKGNCGSCKAQVLDGEAELEIASSYSISEFEQQQGFTLLCSAYALSDLTIEMEGLDVEEVSSGTPPRRFTGTVSAVAELTHDIRSLTIDLDERIAFRAGQFAEVRAPGTDIWRSFSMANAPSQPHRLEFMIKLVPDGAFSQNLQTIRPGTPIELRAPHGAFWVRDHDRPLLMVGGGAGMAPLWSMLQDLADHQDARPVRFFYGARTAGDLFHLDRLAELGSRLGDFTFTPALSHTAGEGPEGCELGLITDVVDRVLGDDISSYDAYLCGPPPMIDAALEMLETYKLEERRSIFYDKFTAS